MIKKFTYFQHKKNSALVMWPNEPEHWKKREALDYELVKKKLNQILDYCDIYNTRHYLEEFLKEIETMPTSHDVKEAKEKAKKTHNI